MHHSGASVCPGEQTGASSTVSDVIPSFHAANIYRKSQVRDLLQMDWRFLHKGEALMQDLSE